MKTRQKRLFAVLATLVGVGIATAMILKAFDQNLLYYTTPSELVAEIAAPDYVAKKYHLGGMVKTGSVQRTENSLAVQFVLTDYTEEVLVHFSGILPDLFREGQGIIAIGRIQEDGSLLAEKVLAKHDENYRPPNLPAEHPENTLRQNNILKPDQEQLTPTTKPVKP
jgi:cytochrome c-type biogenesis protein CcmE